MFAEIGEVLPLEPVFVESELARCETARESFGLDEGEGGSLPCFSCACLVSRGGCVIRVMGCPLWASSLLRMNEDWWVPVVAGAVGGLLPAFVAIASGIMSARKESELQRIELRQAHGERLRERAATAYALAASGADYLELTITQQLNALDAEEPTRIATESISVAREHLRYLSVDGWTQDILHAAERADELLGRATAMTLFGAPPEPEGTKAGYSMAKYAEEATASVSEARKAVDLFRSSVRKSVV